MVHVQQQLSARVVRVDCFTQPTALRTTPRTVATCKNSNWNNERQVHAKCKSNSISDFDRNIIGRVKKNRINYMHDQQSGLRDNLRRLLQRQQLEEKRQSLLRQPAESSKSARSVLQLGSDGSDLAGASRFGLLVSDEIEWKHVGCLCLSAETCCLDFATLDTNGSLG